MITVKDYEKSKAFYLKVLAPLGYSLAMEPMPKGGGFGKEREASDLWIGEGRPSLLGPRPRYREEAAPIPTSPSRRRNRAAVRAFHAAALEAGAKDFGPPGPRPLYHANYYGAFVLDPDGNNIEAVVHAPE